MTEDLKRRESQDWFGIGVRLLAVWLLYKAVESTLNCIVTKIAMETRPYEHHGDREPLEHFVYILGYAAFAVVLLRFVSQLTSFTYQRTE